MNVLMVGVDESTKGGMWTVVDNYLSDREFVEKNHLVYIPTSVTGSIHKRIIFTLKAYFRILKAYFKNHFDITHVHMAERGSVYRKGIVMKMAKIFSSKIILHMHGAEFEVWYRSLKPQAQKKIRKILRMSDAVIILGDYWKGFIGSIVEDSSKIKVVYNAVKIPETNMYSIESRRMLFLGAVSKRKGIDVLLKAMTMLPQNAKDQCRLDIYGPDVEGNIEEKIRKSSLEKNVRYNGWLSKDEKEAVLCDTSLNILPSYNEGLPMTILEAMAYGVPTITTNVAAIPEAVNEENGAVISPGDAESLSMAIERLVTDKEVRAQKSQKAYDDASLKFSLKTHISNVQEIYEKVCSE